MLEAGALSACWQAANSQQICEAFAGLLTAVDALLKALTAEKNAGNLEQSALLFLMTSDQVMCGCLGNGNIDRTFTCVKVTPSLCSIRFAGSSLTPFIRSLQVHLQLTCTICILVVSSE